MKKTFLYIVFYLFVNSFSQAQISADNKNLGFVENLYEQIHFYTDRDFYLSGEEVWFTTYVVINNTFREFELSKVVYLECFDAREKKIFKGKFEIKEGITTGNFQIPLETITGNYFIRAYTKYQRNFPPETFTTKMISIVNPEFSLPKQEQITDTIKHKMEDQELSDQDFKDNIEIAIGTDKTTYNQREQVTLKLQIPEIQNHEMATLCISVIRQGTLRQTDGNISTISDIRSNDQFWIPETRGVSISGIVSEKSSQQTLEGVNVYLSVLGENPQFHIMQTKENGEFIFSLGYLTKTNEIFLGVEPRKEKEIQLLVNNDFSNTFTYLENIPVSIDTNSKNLIEEMLVNYQSKKIFTDIETEDIMDSQTLYNVFNEPDVSVPLADYIDLPNMETIFYELIPSATIKKKGGRKSLHISNPATEWVFENKLLLLDYVPVFDLDAILAMPPEKIEQINVINNTWYLGDNTLRNIVMVNSKGRDFAGYEFPTGSIFIDYQTLSPENSFDAPTYENQTEKDSRIPDFRTLLYWNPKLTIAKGDTTLSFYTSDNVGDYEIIIRGITKNGESCFGKGLIRIE